MQVASAKGRLRGKQPTLPKSQEALVAFPYIGGKHTTVEIADMSTIARIAVPHRLADAAPRGIRRRSFRLRGCPAKRPGGYVTAPPAVGAGWRLVQKRIITVASRQRRGVKEALPGRSGEVV